MLTAKDGKHSTVSFPPESLPRRAGLSQEERFTRDRGRDWVWLWSAVRTRARTRTHKEMLTWQTWHCAGLNLEGARGPPTRLSGGLGFKKKTKQTPHREPSGNKINIIFQNYACNLIQNRGYSCAKVLQSKTNNNNKNSLPFCGSSLWNHLLSNCLLIKLVPCACLTHYDLKKGNNSWIFAKVLRD